MIRLKNAALYYNAYQSKRHPTILFVHGAWLGAWVFRNYEKYFSEFGVPIALIDLRGHGGLSQDELFLASGQQEMADDVVEACAVIDREMIIAGHSAGAAVAAVAASRCSSKGLILLAPSPPAQLLGLLPCKAEIEGEAVRPGPLEKIRKKFVPNLSLEEAEVFASKLVCESPALLNDRRLLRVTIDRERIVGPTLCIAAEFEDAEFHAEGQDEQTAAFYDAEYHLLKGAGHCFMWEPGWYRSAAIILDWYRRNFLPTTETNNDER